MFMRFRGGGVGHIGTRYLDSRMRNNSDRSDAEQQDEEGMSGTHEDESDSLPQEEWGDSIEEESRAHEERISHTEPGNEDTGKGQDEEEDTDKGQDEEEDTDKEQDKEDTDKEQDKDMSESTNDSDEEDLDSDLVDEEVLNDNEILDEEGFAEL